MAEPANSASPPVQTVPPAATASLPLPTSQASPAPLVSAPASKPLRICVFCSTQSGRPGALHVAAAERLARELHTRGAHLVYGGGATGLMGALARERVRLGGPESVTGVIPYGLVASERKGLGGAGTGGGGGLPPGLGADWKRTADKGLVDKEKEGAGDGDGSGERKRGRGGVGSSKIRGLLGALGVKGRAGDRDGSDGDGATKQTTTDGEGDGSGGGRESMPVRETWETWDDVYELPVDPELGQVIGVPSLPQRKAVMIDMVKNGGPGSGFVALPGGFGSLDEVLTVLTARQMGVHSKSMVLCNIDGFWDAFESWMAAAGEKDFLRAESRAFIKTLDSVEEAVRYLVENREWAID